MKLATLRTADGGTTAALATGGNSYVPLPANDVGAAVRADLVALGRTHLFDPQWTLHAAAEQEYQGPGAQWVPQFRAGRRKPPSSRTDAVRPRLSLLKEPESDADNPHLRWTPRSVSAPALAN